MTHHVINNIKPQSTFVLTYYYLLMKPYQAIKGVSAHVFLGQATQHRVWSATMFGLLYFPSPKKSSVAISGLPAVRL